MSPKKKSIPAKDTEKSKIGYQEAVSACLLALEGKLMEVARMTEDQRLFSKTIQETLDRLVKIVDSPENQGSFLERKVDASEHRIIKLEEQMKSNIRNVYLLLSSLIGATGIFLAYFFQK